MKKILYYFVAIGSLLTSAQIASAQHSIQDVIGNLIFVNEKDPKIDPETLVGQRKSISQPQEDGTYWIKIEAFTTGQAEIVTKPVPADIVLLLDLSTSMCVSRGTLSSVARDTPLTYNKVVNARSAAENYVFDVANSDEYRQLFGEYDSSTGRYYLYYNQNGGNTKYYLTHSNSSTRINGNTTNRNNAAYATDPNETIVVNNNSDGQRVYTASSRIFELKQAVDAFVGTINAKDKQGENGARIGNRLSIITFETDPHVIQGMTTMSDAAAAEMKASAWDFVLRSGTQPGKAFVEANDQFANNLRPSTEVLGKDYTRAVVFFTDGEPYDHSGWVDSDGRSATETTGTHPSKFVAVERAKISKNTYKASVFSVGMFSSTPATGGDVWKFLNYVSSNYPEAYLSANTPAGATSASYMNPGDDESKYTTGFYFDASNSNLTSIFTSIAEEAGGSTNKNLTAASSNVDIVTSSFTVTNSAQGKQVHVFTSKCTGVTGEGVDMKFTWDTEIEAKFSEDKYSIYEDGIFVREEDVDDAITKSTSGNVITVTGFDYSNNWCGTVTDGDVTTVQGHKIMILIPVTMSDDAVGGPNVATNTEDSGIYLPGDTPGEDDPVVSFDIPEISLPLNIWIKKKGLEVGESARFIIQRTLTPDNANSWEDVTTVFITHQMAEGSTAEPMLKVMGLPATDDSNAPYTYRVYEDNWDWSYTLKDITDDGETSIREPNTRFAYTYKLVTNPFIFVNEKKKDVIRHAESKATNTFKTGSVVIFDDSKNNNR